MRQSDLVRFIKQNSLSTFAFEISMVNGSITNIRTIFDCTLQLVEDPSPDTQVGCSQRVKKTVGVAYEIMPWKPIFFMIMIKMLQTQYFL